MRNSFNYKLLIIGIGILQPVNLNEVIHFLKKLLPEVIHWPDEESLEELTIFLEKKKYIFCVSRKENLYSLTYMANLNMDKGYRMFRDKLRLFLLNEVYKNRINSSDVVVQNLDGGSPSVITSSTIKDDSRPESFGLQSSSLKGTRLHTKAFWSRISKQQNLKVGFDSPTSDALINSFRYYSFPTLKQLKLASGGNELEVDMSVPELAMCIGVSPGLLVSIIHKTNNHYRAFEIPKKTGGVRTISSPRIFLKTIQYWLKDFLLWNLEVSSSCHAYIQNRSIQTNAIHHVDKRFVANIDIEDYFGSITTAHVSDLLTKNNFGIKLSNTVAKLVTLENSLPQGAPTSPIISNAFLYDFDKSFSDYCVSHKLTYTRYADDMTISGASRERIEEAILYAKKEIENFGLSLKDKKTRIASFCSSQRVTGLVVNHNVLPPREYRKKVRAIFHKAYISPNEYIDRLDELRGHLNYLKSFNDLKENKSLRKYRIVILKLSVYKRRLNKSNDRNQLLEISAPKIPYSGQE